VSEARQSSVEEDQHRKEAEEHDDGQDDQAETNGAVPAAETEVDQVGLPLIVEVLPLGAGADLGQGLVDLGAVALVALVRPVAGLLLLVPLALGVARSHCRTVVLVRRHPDRGTVVRGVGPDTRGQDAKAADAGFRNRS
jgi:hypothetical protein